MGDSMLAGITIGGFIGTLLIGFLFNSLVIWFVTNHMLSLGEKTPFKKCMLCILALDLVFVVSSLAKVFLPFGAIIGIIIYYKGSIAAIEGSIEITKGGLTIWILYSLVNFALLFGLAALLAA